MIVFMPFVALLCAKLNTITLDVCLVEENQPQLRNSVIQIKHTHKGNIAISNLYFHILLLLFYRLWL